MNYVYIHKLHLHELLYLFCKFTTVQVWFVCCPIYTKLPAWPQENSHLPKNEMLADDVLYSFVAPDVAVETLTGKILHVLNVYHEPFVLHLTTLLGLEAESELR